MTGRLVLRDVTRSFEVRGRQRLVALDGIDLAIEPGQIVALIGPNGSGKSTALRLMAGLLGPDRGQVLLDGSPITRPDPRIGLVFQEPRLLPWRSVAANVAYPLELAGWPRPERERRVGELLGLVGLTAASALVPSRLSGGMRQRAALARGLALSPEILLLDEPFSALDELTRERLNLELLGLWAADPTTIVVVTHSIPEALLLADRVVVLSARPGRVVADVRIALPRPRRLELLDEPEAGELAAAVRRALASSIPGPSIEASAA